MTKLTLINCAKENIEEHTNKERVHWHLPTKMKRYEKDMMI